MKRFTIRDEDSKELRVDSYYIQKDKTDDFYKGKAINSLGAYEDTKLTPKQISEMKKVHSKMRRVFGDALTVDEVIDTFLKHYESHSDEKVTTARLLTNEDAEMWLNWKKANQEGRLQIREVD